MAVGRKIWPTLHEAYVLDLLEYTDCGGKRKNLRWSGLQFPSQWFVRHSLEALTLENPQEIPRKVTVHGFVSTRVLTQEKVTAEEWQ